MALVLLLVDPNTQHPSRIANLGAIGYPVLGILCLFNSDDFVCDSWGTHIVYRPPSNKQNFPTVLSHLAGRSEPQPMQTGRSTGREQGGWEGDSVMYGAATSSTSFLPPAK